MKRSFRFLACMVLMFGLSGCGVFKKGCNCPKVSSLKAEAQSYS